MHSPTPLYSPLDADNAQIRLLVIAPGQVGDSIRTLFTTVSLDDHPTYEAISYVWGDSKDRRSIDVTGHTRSVTKSLHDALSRFRNTHAPRVVWADALCINQDDIKERGSQVSLMARIYRQCSVCQVWLGDMPRLPVSTSWVDEGIATPGFMDKRIRGEFTEEQVAAMMPVTDRDPKGDETESDPQAAVAVMCSLARIANPKDWPSFRLISKDDGQTELGICPRWMRGGRTFAMIMYQSWWTRVWTFQEAALAPQTILNLGIHEFDLSLVLSAALRYLERRSQHTFECTISGETIDPGGKLMRRVHELGLRYLEQILGNSKRSMGNDTLIHLKLVAIRDATNPLDRVFGFLGVMPHLLGADTVVDYGMGLGTCFARATRQRVKLTSTLTYLSTLTKRLEQDPLYDGTPLPSWAIDYLDKHPPGVRLPGVYYRAYGSDAASVYQQANETFDDNELPIRISILDRIDEVYRLQNEGTNCHAEPEHRFLQGCRYWMKTLGTLYEANKARFWRTICTDANVLDPFGLVEMMPAPHTHRLPTDGVHQLETLFVDLETCDATATSLSDYRGITVDKMDYQFVALLSMMALLFESNAALFTCSMYGYGSGLATFKSGDSLAIVQGVEVPVVLREVQGAGIDNNVKRFKFVGPCYIDGVMYGEAMTDEIVWDPAYLV